MLSWPPDTRRGGFGTDDAGVSTRNTRLTHALLHACRRADTTEECDALRKGAEPRLERSGVRNVDTAKKVDEVVFPEYRTSFNMFFNRGENEVVKGACVDS